MIPFKIQQCADYGSDGDGKHDAANGTMTFQKNDVYYRTSYFFENIFGTSDASISKVIYFHIYFIDILAAPEFITDQGPLITIGSIPEQVFFIIEPGRVREQNYLRTTWKPGQSTGAGCDTLTVHSPKTLFLFGYALLSRYENRYFNSDIGKQHSPFTNNCFHI